MDYFTLQQSITAGLLAHPWLLAIVAAWSLCWKGVALWHAARLKQVWWFIPLLVVNLVGLLEIFYIFVIVPKERKKRSIEA